MTSKNILITGGYGCIGSEAAKWLLKNTNDSIVICSRKVSKDRTARVFDGVDCDRLQVIEADVTDQQKMHHLLESHKINTIIHMAALQTPDCNANRDLGLQINLAGTQNLIEAIKTMHPKLDRFVFASSVAVYGPRDYYPTERVPMNAEPMPVNVYGVWKLAAEHLARLFHAETGIPTICLRPGVLYGPGRDAGLTASPTTAMKCIALGRPFEIPFRSRQDYQYAPDVGAAVGISATAPFSGYGYFTLPSHTLETSQMVESMRNGATKTGMDSSFQISVGDGEVPFICDLEFEPFVSTFPNVPHTPLDVAVEESLVAFQSQVERGWLKEEDLML